MLRGEKVCLTPLDPANATTARAWINDAEINRYLLTGQIPVTLEGQDAFYRKAEEDWRARTGFRFEIRIASDDRYIGNCGLEHVDLRHGSAEIGICIGEADAQNKGYGSDAIITLLRFGFDTLRLNRIEIRSSADNERSLHLYEKLGFTPTGRLR
jgi:RimJ/RimL family protein N-acetyltransferase